MSFYVGGTQINQLFIGAAEIKKAYLGTTLVHDRTAVVPSVGLTFLGSALTEETGTSITVAHHSVADGSLLRVIIACVGGKGPSSVPAGWSFVMSDTSNANIEIHTYEKIAGAAEPATTIFSTPSAGHVGISTSWSGALVGGVTGLQPGAWGGSISAPSITATAESDVLEVFASRSITLTRAGSLQNSSYGGVNLAISLTQAVAGGATAAQQATVSSNGHRLALQWEALKA